MNESSRWLRLVLAFNAILLIGGALWLRTFSLASLPEHHSDESFYGLQTYRLIHGETPLGRTPSRNLLSPLFVLAQAPFTAVLGPSIWTLRLPAVISGLAAAVVLFVVVRRTLDERTAALAALGLLAFPAAVWFSRIGWEISQPPLVAAVALGLLWAGRPLALLGWLVLAPMTHPTNIFLVPFLAPAAIVASRRDGRWIAPRTALALLVGSIALVVGFAILMRGNANVAGHASTSRNVVRFLDGLVRFVVFWDRPDAPAEAFAPYLWGVLVCFVMVATLGLSQLIRDRDRGRLAILAGWVLVLVAFDWKAGSLVLADVGVRRYGAVLIVPTLLSASILLEAALRPLLCMADARIRLVGWAMPAAIGWMMIGATITFAYGPFLKAGHRLTALVTADPFAGAAEVIRSEAPERHETRRKTVVVAQDQYLNGLQLEYLLADRHEIHVTPFLTLLEVWKLRTDPSGAGLADRRDRLGELLRDGAFVVALPESPDDRGRGIIEDVVARSLDANDVSRWPADCQVVYRRRALPVEPVYVAPGKIGKSDELTRAR